MVLFLPYEHADAPNERAEIRPNGLQLSRACDWARVRTCVHTCVHIHMHTHIPSARHVDLAVGRATDRPAYLGIPLHKKPKSPTESLKSSTPRLDFKSFRFDGRSRNMGILSKPSAYAAKIPNFAL